MVGSTASFAYRPFDGTDAAVADPQEVEIELEPAGILRRDAQTSLVAPFMIFNYGFAKNWEFVFQGQGQFPLVNSDESASINGVGAFLKGVLREGSLQDASGPSIAVEFGPLLPGVRADSGFGASFGTIVSQRWEWGTVHANVVTELPGWHHRGALEVEGAAGRGVLLRRGDRTVANRIGPGRCDLAGEGQSQLRCWLSPCCREWASG